MLDRKFIRKEPDKVIEGLRAKGVEFNINEFLELDVKMRDLMQETENLKQHRNTVSRNISALKKECADASALMIEMKENSNRIREIDHELKEIEDRISELEKGIPNLPHESVPFGTCDADNPEVRRWGEIPEQPGKVLVHEEIGEKLGILDMSAGALISGRGFVVLRGDGARLSRALVSLMLDIHREQGYEEFAVPYLVNRDSMTGTGQLPKMAEDMYHCEKDDLFLVPTAEVPLTNIYRDAMLDGGSLPIKATAFSPCFRREAGSYGQETKGLIRVHQFDKVEMVRWTLPEKSYEELEILLGDACTVLEVLELPYRVIELCSGDLSFSAAKCYDIETWAPGSDRWLEVSSCSNFEDFQARRARIRFKRGKGAKPEFVHTLNGSGLALPRIIVTILELNQTPTGKIRIPKALVPYMGGQEYIEA
jgi:seryl-tRNA synthetase